MTKAEKLKNDILDNIASKVRENQHLFPIDASKEDIYLNDSNEKLMKIGGSDIDTYLEDDFEEFSYSFWDLPIELLEEIETIIDNAIVDSNKTMDRCQD